MNRRTFTYMFDGDTFVGRYRLSSQNHGPTVSVQFEDCTRSASLGSRPEEQVARALLGQLVRERVGGRPPQRRDAGMLQRAG